MLPYPLQEFGLFEQEAGLLPTVTWRTQAIVDALFLFGVQLAFHWELFDNECTDSQGNVMPLTTIALPVGDPNRPGNSNCKGLWLIRPDGTEGLALQILKQFWGKAT